MSQKQKKESGSGFPTIGYRIILFISCVPLSLIIGRWLPEMILPIGDGFSAHPIVAFLIAMFLLEIVLFPFRKILSVVGLIGSIVLAVMVYRGDISQEEVKDYFWQGVSEVTKHEFGGRSINHQPAIEKAIKDSSGLYMFVEKHKSKYLSNECMYPSVLASFAMFDEVSRNWDYKLDPKYRELFRSVSETIVTKTGDCDDHAICLATCMKACGARSRIIHTRGHLYPELYVGNADDKEAVKACIYELYPTSKGAEIYFNVDEGELWLSMDYTEDYPGGINLGDQKLEKMELD